MARKSTEETPKPEAQEPVVEKQEAETQTPEADPPRPGVTAFKATEVVETPVSDEAQANPNMMVLNRSFTLVTKLGQTIRFIKDQPVHVPPPVQGEAMGIGATMVNGETPDLTGSTGRDPEAPTDPVERTKALIGAIEGIEKRGIREDFTAAGAPHHKAVTRALGWRVDQREVAAAVQKRNDALAQALEGEGPAS